MSRKVRDKSIEDRTARSKLKARGKPHFRALEPGLHLGYRKPVGGRGKALSGQWVARHYLGAQAYKVEVIGTADDFSDADGISILSYGQAQQEARKRMQRRAKDAAGVTGPLTVLAACEAYVAHLDAVRGEKAAADARNRIETHIRHSSLASIEIDTLRPEMLRAWHVALSKSPPRLRTGTDANGERRSQNLRALSDEESLRRRRVSANRIFSALRASLNLAFREGKVASDQAWRRVRPFQSVDVARIRWLTVDEVRRLVNACDPDFRKLVQAALQTGARYGELCRLEVQDFDARAGTVSVRQSKSGKPRHIFLTDEGRALFQQWCAGRAGAELLFTKDGKPWTPSLQNRPMAEAVKRARITPPATFHTLRHTWCSLSAMAGVPLFVVAENLGHRDTRMVERHYGHLAPSFVAAAIRAGAPRFGMEPEGNVKPLRPRS
jgi:integrase